MTTLRLLLLEDNPFDAELVLAQLAEARIDCEPLRVQTRDDFHSALTGHRPDLILADFSLPAFDGFSALQIAQQVCPETPFLFVSGAIGEERAIESLKRGATDYVLKQRLERLVPSVERALREAGERRERRRLEQELRQRAEELAEAHHRKDEFLAMLSHELRNPLAPIRNALQLIQLRGGEDPVLLRARDILCRQVQHLTQLVEDLLDVTRVTRGKIQLRREWVDLAAAMARAVETVRPLIDQRQHRLQVSAPAEPCLVHADPVRLEQILVNLLTNAAKYTDPGGRIHLEGRREASAVLRVRDNGIGIGPEMQTRIFDLFAQATHTLDRSQGGLGIGLTLVRTLVELHQGSIEVSSAGAGCGSEFTVRLPLAVPPHEQGTSNTAVEEDPASENLHVRRVLVVDDNRDGAESLGMILRHWGHVVRLAFEGPPATEIARELSPDVVLLDIGLPGMDGYEVARRLRAEPTTRTAILVAMTGYGQEEDRRRSREAGFDYHLVKPPDLKVLENLLTDLALRNVESQQHSSESGNCS